MNNTRQQLVIVDNEYYTKNAQALNLAVRQTDSVHEQVEFPIQLDIPRVNWGVCHRLCVPFMGDEYYGLRICVKLWLWRDTNGLDNLAPAEIGAMIPCPIREIRLWRNGHQIYSCQEFRIGDDGFGGSGVVLGSGKLVTVMFEPISEMPMPIINRLRERYDDYVLDVEFGAQPGTENKLTTGMEKHMKTEKPKITLRTATANLLTRVYSIDVRRNMF
jgi:hypothetical protein